VFVGRCSPQYGKFMTMDEVSDLIGTSAEDMAVALGEFQSVAGIDCAPHVGRGVFCCFPCR
jgi:hypothetical protein